MFEDENENLRDELGTQSELHLAQICEKLDLSYPLMPFYQKLEELIDKLAYELTLAKWCLKEGKSFDDFEANKS